MIDPYVIIKNQSEYLTVELPSLRADKYWEYEPNHTPNWDGDNSYLLEINTRHLIHQIVYPKNFKYENLLIYLQTEQPELLI